MSYKFSAQFALKEEKLVNNMKGLHGNFANVGFHTVALARYSPTL